MSENLLFNRSASLTVITKDKVGRQLVAKDFEGLRIAFNIEKTSESLANQAKIKIFNLSPSSRAFVEERGQAIILKAGYAPADLEPLVEVIFQGDVGKVTNSIEGPDWITSFEVGDGEKSLTEKSYQKTFRSGASAETIMREIAASMGLAVGTIKGIKDKAYKSGVTLSGSAKDLLDQLTGETGVEWSVQDEEIQILPKTEGTNDEVIVVSASSGMINAPIKRADGIDVVSLINPQFRPGRRIQIESKNLNGIYRIRKLTFDGDTRDGDWKAKLECVNLNTPVQIFSELPG